MIKTTQGKTIMDNIFLNELLKQSWLDIENLQKQIDTIESTSPQSRELIEIIKDFLTSNLVYVGCLENLLTKTQKSNLEKEIKLVDDKKVLDLEEPLENSRINNSTADTDFEPFEYFVDFEEPQGDPLTDEDLYNT